MPLAADYPVDISGSVVGESSDCLLLSETVVCENPDLVCWLDRRLKRTPQQVARTSCLDDSRAYVGKGLSM